MKKLEMLAHEFVEYIPEVLRPGCIYVSIQYATAIHLCCCGCGSRIVTPLSPTDWRLIYDGRSISLEPSIGNWSLPCRTHYWITRGKIRWAAKWSDKEIESARKVDAERKSNYLESIRRGEDADDDFDEPTDIRRGWLG